jgi:hypothetical protein
MRQNERVQRGRDLDLRTKQKGSKVPYVGNNAYQTRENTMTVTAIFATGTPISIECDPWLVEAAVESFYDIGAIAVSTKA